MLIDMIVMGTVLVIFLVLAQFGDRMFSND